MERSSGGIRAAARRVVAHGRALVQLERELARAELQRKGASLGGGAALLVAAGVLAVFALAFGLATMTAALALVLPWWAALLVVFVLLLALVAVLGLVGVSLLRKATPPIPEQAIEEARLTKRILRGSRAG